MKKLTYEELLALHLSEESLKTAVRHPIAVILSNIRSLYNVGSIFRTADSAMISELILCGFTPCPPRKEILKTALGATETVPWRYFESTAAAIIKLKSEGWNVAALELTNKSIDYNLIAAEHFPLAIVAGNEITGVDNEVLQLCDFAIELPMYGIKHSLNVSVAVGIAVYNTLTKLNLKKYEKN